MGKFKVKEETVKVEEVVKAEETVKVEEAVKVEETARQAFMRRRNEARILAGLPLAYTEEQILKAHE